MDAQHRENIRRNKIVIKELRNHQVEVDREKNEAVDCRSDVLTKHFKKTEENLNKSKTVDQALIDAQIFATLAGYTKRQAAQLQTGLQTYDVKTYTDHLVHYMRRTRADAADDAGGEDDEFTDGMLSINFIQLGASVRKCNKAVPAIDFMHGNAPVENVVPVAERKKAKRVQKGKITVKPHELKSDEVEQTETDRQVAEMKRELERRKQCNYWIFVIDPKSFTRSIENLFHSSFLIKDRMAFLDLKVDPPVIRCMDARDRRHDQGGGDEGGATERQSQFIMGFDRNVWKEMIGKYNIRKCILPSKNAANGVDEQMRRLSEMQREEETAAF